MAKFSKNSKVWFVPGIPERIWSGWVRHYDPTKKRYEIESFGCSFGLFEHDLYSSREEALEALEERFFK